MGFVGRSGVWVGVWVVLGFAQGALATIASFSSGPSLSLGGRIVAIGDFDDDGDKDVVVADANLTTPVLRVLWNDGQIPPTFSSESLSSSGSALAAGRIFNLVSRQDQIVVAIGDSIHARSWIGTGFSDATLSAAHGASDFWIRELDLSGRSYVYYAAGTTAGYLRLDNPGISDVGIASSTTAEAFRAVDVLANLTGAVLTGAEGTRVVASGLFSTTPGYDVKRADVDRDGIPDVVVATDDQLVWHRCLSTNVCQATANPISPVQSFRAWRDVEVADLDFDGDLDVLAVDGGQTGSPPPLCQGNLVWYENDGGAAPAFTQRNLICFTESSNPNSEWPASAELGDLDGDGDLDAVWGAALDQLSGISSAPGTRVNAASFSWIDGGMRQGLGANVLGRRDLNRDGFQDALVATHCTYSILGGCPGNDRRYTVKLFAGTATGLDPIQAWAAEGAQENDRFGSGLAFGDWNADGYVDVAIGAPRHQGGCDPAHGEKVGRVYVWRGGPADAFNPSGLGPGGSPANADQIFLPPQTFTNSLCYPTPIADGLGAQLAVLDFNGDQIDDLAASDPGLFHYECGPGEDVRPGRGQVVLYRGSTSGLVFHSRIEGEACPLASCPCSGFGIGEAIAAGAFGGDARDDLAISYERVPAGDFGVNVYLSAADRDNPSEDPDQTIETASRRDAVSLAVADTDADGWDDLALSEINPFDGARLSLLRGNTSGLAATSWEPLAGGSVASISSAGQQNRDCYEDVAAASATGTQLYRGQAGSAGPQLLPALQLLPSWLRFGPGGDVQADGTDDLLVGNEEEVRGSLTERRGAAALYQGDVDTSVAVPDCDGDGSPRNLDCDDRDPSIEPGAPERCNLRDDDCDRAVDEDLACSFQDSDGDGALDDGDHSGIPGDDPCRAGERLDCDDNCRVYANPDQTDVDGNAIGNLCECGDQNGDGRVNVADLVAINLAIFNPSLATPLCDTNQDGLCNVSDIVGANLKIFGRPAYCSRYPRPMP